MAISICNFKCSGFNWNYRLSVAMVGFYNKGDDYLWIIKYFIGVILLDAISASNNKGKGGAWECFVSSQINNDYWFIGEYLLKLYWERFPPSVDVIQYHNFIGHLKILWI